MSPIGCAVRGLCLIAAAVAGAPGGAGAETQWPDFQVRLSPGASNSPRLAALPDGLGAAVTAMGQNAKLKDELRAALTPETPVDDLTARSVHGHFAGKLAATLQAGIEVSEETEGEVRLALLVPPAAG